MAKRILSGLISAVLFLVAILVFRSWFAFKPAQESDLSTVRGTIKDVTQTATKSPYAEFHLSERPVRFRITPEDYNSGLKTDAFLANVQVGSVVEIQAPTEELDHPWHPLGVKDGIVNVATLKDGTTTYLTLEDHNSRSSKTQIGKLFVIATCVAFGIVLLSGAIKGMREN